MSIFNTALLCHHASEQCCIQDVEIGSFLLHDGVLSFNRWTGMADLATLLTTNDPRKKSTMKPLSDRVQSIPDLVVTMGMRANMLTILPWLKESMPILIVSMETSVEFDFTLACSICCWSLSKDVLY